ncbi:L-rhamnose mutarotase [Mucilaginibacter rubeus]|uniref:L-rhamnose mutarotase n=2 Tax=Sphingobacteriaceae TaxID=84566 RepID=A0AAE6MMK9_9SPHI|nr:L-rhamnose mutarotase [Mucilaginibacter rubeus]QEM20760.1 L-rhamnose mutarotase [Mucilaginibacter gossypii]QTE46999.1 L-rhamnose mutarotase [Mucilaginibacter rubeus]QTE53602.1 L-rhamnose mutarotase [Mucilaginibacter rubeus]QTE60102.1 L-rhamnose mutarotase [Mucilaginibacter rubeus]
MSFGACLTWVLSGCDLPPQSNPPQTDTVTKAKPRLIARPAVIEIIAHDKVKLDPDALYDIEKSVDGDADDIKQWKNHAIMYLHIPNPEDALKEIKKAYPDDSIKYYEKPFYAFNRRMCADTVSSKQWENIVMTANLVNDPKLQREYLNYHTTQFKNWPEVAKGFCNANFQQLLVFKNGRQLMLVISIPKGESLDKLNSKTTENNPRVNEWNSLMKKYQEGIYGAKPGEVWVEFKPVHTN